MYFYACGIFLKKAGLPGRKDFGMGKVLSLGNQFRSTAGLVPILLLTKLFGVSIWEGCWAKGYFCLQYTNKSLFVCRVSFQLYSSSSSSPQNLIWCSRVHLMFSKAVCPENLNEASSPPIQLTPPTPQPLPPQSPDEKPAKLCLLSTNNASSSPHWATLLLLSVPSKGFLAMTLSVYIHGGAVNVMLY